MRWCFDQGRCGRYLEGCASVGRHAGDGLVSGCVITFLLGSCSIWRIRRSCSHSGSGYIGGYGKNIRGSHRKLDERAYWLLQFQMPRSSWAVQRYLSRLYFQKRWCCYLLAGRRHLLWPVLHYQKRWFLRRCQKHLCRLLQTRQSQ